MVFASLEDLNQRYAYCSGIAPEQIIFLSHDGTLRIPFYRWDPHQKEIVKQNIVKHSFICPLYREMVEFRAVSEYTLSLNKVITKYCLIDKIKYFINQRKVLFITDFPFPINLRLDRWDVVIYPSEQVIGKYVEHVTCLLFAEGVDYEFLLEPTAALEQSELDT
jgi:hypothetical protein